MSKITASIQAPNDAVNLHPRIHGQLFEQSNGVAVGTQ
jgi:hypothetical protein